MLLWLFLFENYLSEFGWSNVVSMESHLDAFEIIDEFRKNMYANLNILIRLIKGRVALPRNTDTISDIASKGWFDLEKPPGSFF